MFASVITPFGKMAQNDDRWRRYIAAIVAGDRQALSQLYDETSSVVYGLALRMLNDATAAGEVLLWVYQQVWTSPQTFKDSPSVLATLTVMTRRHSLEQSGGQLNLSAPPAVSGSKDALLEQERALVMRALTLLEPAHREAIELAFFSGMKDGDLAHALGTSQEVVRARISSGMRKLNEALKLVNSTEGNA